MNIKFLIRRISKKLPGNELSGNQKKLIAGPNGKMEEKNPYLKISSNQYLAQLFQVNPKLKIIKYIKIAHQPSSLHYKNKKPKIIPKIIKLDQEEKGY